MFDEYPDIMTVVEIAKALRISKNTAYELVSSKLIPSVRIGRRIIIPKKAVVDFLEHHTP